MSRYTCYECKAEHGTDNVEAVCVQCFARLSADLEAANKKSDAISKRLEWQIQKGAAFVMEREDILLRRAEAAEREARYWKKGHDDLEGGMQKMASERDENKRRCAELERREQALLAYWDHIEERSEEAHDVYQKEAHRRGDVRHPDSYNDLSEPTKEWDRVLVRWVNNRVRIFLGPGLNLYAAPQIAQEETREQQWRLRFDVLEGMIETRDKALAECRRLVDKMLEGGHFDRKEWDFLAKLPAPQIAGKAKEPCAGCELPEFYSHGTDCKMPAPAPSAAEDEPCVQCGGTGKVLGFDPPEAPCPSCKPAASGEAP